MSPGAVWVEFFDGSKVLVHDVTTFYREDGFFVVRTKDEETYFNEREVRRFRRTCSPVSSVSQEAQ